MLITSVFDTSDALYDAARALFQTVAQTTTDTLAATLIPGGKTPVPLFESIAKQVFPIASCFRIGYTDERLVPDNDPENNFALSKDMLTALGIGNKQTLRVYTSLPLKAAAGQYDSEWRVFLEMGGNIPLAFLGLGTDGHTCSLFSPEQVQACPPNQFAVAAPQQNGPDRVTVSPALLARVQHAVILVTGQEKAAVVDAMTNTPHTVTAGIALAQCPRVSLWYAPQP